RPTHYRAVRDFRIAAESGDAERLASLLDPGVAVVVDSGETQPPTIRAVGGICDAIALLLHGMAAQPGLALAERSINGQAGLTLSRGDEVTAAMNVDFTGRLISMVWIRLRPEMVRHWNKV
ncbi:MAG TPA: hypothetical protein VFT63_01980, partial [bacterium]|nr:hypothetical protein [bacterium]